MRGGPRSGLARQLGRAALWGNRLNASTYVEKASRRRRWSGPANVLKRIPKRSTTVLTNSHGVPWTRDGFGSSFNKAKIAAGMQDSNLHFHDLRGSAATRFYTVGLSERVIAEIMGWEEDHVARIMRRYVGRAAATKAIIRRINEARERT